MRFKQIEYAIAVAQNKSFSKAAEELFVSQPNISSTINTLENELGFKIFDRTNKGIDITVEGAIFLRHANHIMEELNSIPSIIKKESLYKLSIGSTFSHTIVSKAFVQLCNHYQESENISFSMYNDSTIDIIENVYMNEIDLGIIFLNPVIFNNYKNKFGTKNLEFQILATMNLNVNIRKEHPLLQFKNFYFEDLYNFPFVNYIFNRETSINLISDFPDIVSLGIINHNKIIDVTERQTRREIILTSDAFSIGSSFHPKMNQIDEIVSVPIPNAEAALVLVKRKGTSMDEEVNIFIDFLMKELSKVIDMSDL